MIVMVEESMLSFKLKALLTRKKVANRDLFDLWYFVSKNWQFDKKPAKKDIKEAIKKIEAVKENEILYGLGDLLEDKQKEWVKVSLKKELIFNLRLLIAG